MISMIEAQKTFQKSLSGYKASAGKTVAAAWSSVNALADVVRAATAAGLNVKQAWDACGELLKDEDKTLVGRWRYAAFGIANGMQPEAGEDLKAFAKRCGKPSGLSKQGGEGPRGPEVKTAAQRAKKLRSAEKDAASVYAKLVEVKASKALLDKAAALHKEVGDAAAAEEAAAAVEQAARQ